MELCQVFDSFVDERGEITDLLRGQTIDGVTRIRTVKGAVRGNHRHRQTLQFTVVLSGALRVMTRLPDAPAVEGTLTEGQMMVSPPNEWHAWEALEDTDVIVLTQGPRSGENYESDVVQMMTPLIP